jgi:hypothetical protein
MHLSYPIGVGVRPLVGPVSIITAINNGCNRAYSDDVADTVTIVQAITGNF